MKEFKKALTMEAKRFKKWLKSESKWEVYSHLDADGISSAAIMINYLKNYSMNQFRLRIVQQLDDEVIKEIEKSKLPTILCDLGTGQLSRLKKAINNNKIVILDHHQPEKLLNHDNLIHINPCLHGVDGSKTISASGVIYLFLKEAGLNNPLMASIALIGAKGDGQDMKAGLNYQILKQSSIKERKDLNVYGHNLRPVHKVLEYSNDYEIPGITGNETNAVMMLQELGIKLKNEETGEWRTLSDLTSNEKQRLISGVIIKRKNLDNPEDVFKTVYEFNIGLIKNNLEEWSSMLNACGRMDKPSTGISLLMEEDDGEVSTVLSKYRRELAGALRWINENKDKILLTNKAVYIKAHSAIPFKLIGTICSITAINSLFDKEFIIGISEKNSHELKISVRSRNDELNTGLILRQAVKEFGQGGGHLRVGGAVIKKEYEAEFISNFERLLNS